MVEKVITNDRRMYSSNKEQSESTVLQNKTSELNFVRDKLESFQATIISDVEKRMSGMIDEIMQELRQHELQTHEFKNFAKTQHQRTSSTWNNRIVAPEKGIDDAEESTSDASQKTKGTTKQRNASPSADKSSANQNGQKRVLPDKVFVTRESYLTALLEVDHMKTIYHIFYIILMVFLMNSMCHDYFVEGRMNFGLGTFKAGFDKIHYVLLALLLEHVFVFTLYYAFKSWATVRSKLSRQPSLQRFWSHSCLITYISSQLVFGYVASALCLKLDLPFVSASVLLLETTRLLMKMHAFVRTNGARNLASKLKADESPEEEDHASGTTMPDNHVHVPHFSCYLYFLFAPTLIYRDSYPRTAQIRWKFALARFLEVVAIAFLYSYIHERYIKVHFANYGREELSENALIVKFFGMLMPSTVILLCGFYLILHSWLNFTSELLRFGDRMFYRDWWTASSYDAYYRNWNVVVHDWLYEYIYKDFYTYVFRGSKLAASLMVFMVSALVHEHLVAFALQLFFPVLFVFFGVVGVLFVFATRNAPKSLGNIFIWWTLIIGYGLMVSLYSMEYYAGFNCPKAYNSWVDYLVPRMWSCYNK